MDASAVVSCDVLVIGSGASGMAAAIAARWHGLDVLLVEKQHVLGGTTARSAGGLWIPCNPVCARAGIRDSRETARVYIKNELGARFDPERVDTYLTYGPRMVEFFERHTAVKFVAWVDYPDYHSNSPGSLEAGGRSLYAEPFDGRAVGPIIAKLAPPQPTQTALGMMFSPLDIEHFQQSARSVRSFVYVLRRLVRHRMDLLRYGRTMVLTNGNALVARLMKSAVDLGIPLWTSSPARDLITVDGAVRGALVDTPSGVVRVTARRGVVLASGGFGHDLERCRELFNHSQGEVDWSLAATGVTGDGLRLAESVGGQIDRSLTDGALWAPVSRVPSLQKEFAGHYCDRQRPGMIAVLRNGRRFVNEAASYHDFGRAMIRACPVGEEVSAFIICDHPAIRRYGVGFALPRPMPLEGRLKSGYLLRGDTIAELAGAAGIDSAELAATVEEFNKYARQGQDHAFGKGTTACDRYFGDPERAPNGNIGPIEHPPFYAVKIGVGHMGTLAGAKTDRYARVLNDADMPIAGLYAVGNDMSNMFGGAIPGGGATLGPGMTFGFIAGRHLAGIDGDDAAPQDTRRQSSVAQVAV